MVGRGLRRRSYDVTDDGRFEEEVAKVFGVPFEVVPFKASHATPKPKPRQRHIHAVPQKSHYAITVPRVLGYAIGIRNRVAVADWDAVARLKLDPMAVPPETDLAAMLNQGRPSINAPGGVHDASLAAFRARHREQELVFQMAGDLTKQYVSQPTCEALAHVLFPQLLEIVRRYIVEKVDPVPPARRLDAFIAPYYGWIIERLTAAIAPDTAAGEAPEIPELDRDHPCVSADISVFTARDVREAQRTHVNLVVNDTITWEQSAAYHLDRHPAIRAFVKNHGLNFAVPYLHNGKPSEYIPDWVARLEQPGEHYLIIELKGADWEGLAEIKAQAAHRWCAAITATGEFGTWTYTLARGVGELVRTLDAMQPAAVM